MHKTLGIKNNNNKNNNIEIQFKQTDSKRYYTLATAICNLLKYEDG